MLASRASHLFCKRTNSPRIICFHSPVATRFPLCQTVEIQLPNYLAAPAVVQSFHSSSTLGFPIRRRRHGAGSTEDDNNTDHRPKDSEAMGLRQPAVTDPDIFARESAKLLDKIFYSLDPLKSSNDNFILTRGHEEDVGDFILLDLGPVHGQYNIQVDLEQKVVMMQSPISGQLLYILSASTGDWCGDVDGHHLEGLLVRDLIRQINGVPKF